MVVETSLRRLRPFSLLVVLLLLCSVASYAQNSGNIQGVVSDPAGAAITEASVQWLDVDTGVSTTTKTSGSGNYRFSSLPPGGRYVLEDG